MKKKNTNKHGSVVRMIKKQNETNEKGANYGEKKEKAIKLHLAFQRKHSNSR